MYLFFVYRIDDDKKKMKKKKIYSVIQTNMIFKKATKTIKSPVKKREKKIKKSLNQIHSTKRVSENSNLFVK